MTNFLRDTMFTQEPVLHRPKEEVAEILQADEIPGMEISQQEAGFEFITKVTMWNFRLTIFLIFNWISCSFYHLKEFDMLDCIVNLQLYILWSFKDLTLKWPWLFQTKLPSRPEVKRSAPLTAQEWSKHMDTDGRIKNVEHLKDVMFRGVCREREMCYVMEDN